MQVEGLVHVANMSKRPINSAKDFVKRGQDVWVKVLNLATGTGTGPAAQRVSLSMRDVDQATGVCTLLP
jgi:ATP-dependent RNA helicase DHX8/PRP22